MLSDMSHNNTFATYLEKAGSGEVGFVFRVFV